MKLIQLFRKEEPKQSVPYLLRNGLEDTAAINIKMLLEIQSFLTALENELEIQRNLIGQIRNGQYDKSQPAAKRNGRVREAT